MSNELLNPIFIFCATLLGGVCVVEYSMWRTKRMIGKVAKEYGLKDIIKVLKELKEALI